MKINKLFSTRQFGFINGRSTVLQLLKVIDKWTEALEVPHDRLVGKLKSFHINDGIIEWVRIFLSNRVQQVIVSGQTSGVGQRYQWHTARKCTRTSPVCDLYKRSPRHCKQ